jgi:LPS-assembly lipoprotein
MVFCVPTPSCVRNMKRIALVCACMLAGCGFHLRSYNVDASFDSFFVAGTERSAFASELRQTLKNAGVSEAASRSDASVVIEILDERNLQRAASTTGNARVAEYELDVGVYASILDGSGKVLAEPQWISRVRVYRIDRDNLTGNSQEQALIQRELRADVSQALLRTVNAVARGATKTADYAG